MMSNIGRVNKKRRKRLSDESDYVYRVKQVVIKQLGQEQLDEMEVLATFSDCLDWHKELSEEWSLD